jgi:hypothetical protein
MNDRFGQSRLTMVELQLGDDFTTGARIFDELDKAGELPRENDRQQATQKTQTFCETC